MRNQNAMTMSDLIAGLEKAKKDYGDPPVCLDDKVIVGVLLEPLKDGVSYPIEHGSHNEIGLTFIVDY